MNAKRLWRGASFERWHYVLGEPAQLLLEFLRPDALRPVDHEVLEAGIFGRDRLDAVDHVAGRAAEPRLLGDAVGERGRARRRPGRAPGAALLVGVAHEAERREPLVALVVRGLDLARRFRFAVGEIDAGTPDHVLAELLALAILRARGLIGAHAVAQDLLAVDRHHRLEAVLRHHVDRLAARDRHPDLDRPMPGSRHHRDLAQGVAAIVDRRRAFVVFALV